jgi:prephenate dehydrogenase
MTVPALSAMTAVVFGGGAGWGQRVCEALRRRARRVIVIEKDATAGQIRDAVAASALVFLAVPDPLIAGLLQVLRPQLADGRLVIDCASNKSGFAHELTETAAAGASVCSTHPMVVSTTSPRGHNVLIMPVGAHAGSAVAAAEAIFGALGMTLERFEFERHGDAMVIVQMVPHLVQRILIQALGHGLSQAAMTIADISRIAPANYLLAELGVGRVASQRPDVSAGVIASALQQPFGRQIIDDIRAMLVKILEAGGGRDELAALFAGSVATLDPDARWRDEMTVRTEAALIRLGNLRSRHFVVEAPNQRGVLRDILSILIDGHNIDMTALDSQVVLDDSGAALARFEIGITDEPVDFTRLAADLQAIGVRLIGTGAD